MSSEQTKPRGVLWAYGRTVESRVFEIDAGLEYTIEREKLVPLFPPISPPEGRLPHLKFTNIESPEVDRILNVAITLGRWLTIKRRPPKEIADTLKVLLDDRLSRLPREVVQRICPKRGANLDIVTLLYEDQTDAYGAYLLYSGIPTLENFITAEEVVAS